MTRFVILKNPDLNALVDKPRAVLVRDHFSLLALIFPLFWLLWHRLWFAAAMAFIGFIAIALITSDVRLALAAVLLNALLGFFVAIEGSAWRIAQLQRHGYQFADVVLAQTREEAELLALDKAPLSAPKGPLVYRPQTGAAA